MTVRPPKPSIFFGQTEPTSRRIAVMRTVTNNEIAYFCCNVDANGNPDTCDQRDKSAACGTAPNYSFYPVELMVGKLWEDDGDFDVTKGLLDTAWAKYGVSNWGKYNLFVNTGTNARVDY
jgi:hypothetical protein